MITYIIWESPLNQHKQGVAPAVALSVFFYLRATNLDAAFILPVSRNFVIMTAI